MTNSETDIVTLHSFLRIMRKHWILLSAVALAVGIGVWAVYSVAMYKPVYSSSSRFYVSNISRETPLYSSGQTAGAESMATYCADYIKGSVVLNAVLEEAGLTDQMSPAQLARMISTNVSVGSAAFSVTVSGPDPKPIFQISQAIERVLPVYVDYFNQQSETPEGVGKSAMLKLIDESTEDQRPDNRATLYRYPVFAGLLAFVLVYVFLLIRAIFDRTIYGKRDFEEKLPNMPIFGVIPHWEISSMRSANHKAGAGRKRRRNRELHSCMSERVITAGNVPFQVSEAFRQLCTNVTFCSGENKGCVLGSSSSFAGSGKSFVMANLALSLSQLIDKKVLLVDADMRCPIQHQIFRLENKHGLSNLLAGQISDSKELRHPLNQSLDLITSGTIPPNPIALLCGPVMRALMNQWKEEYDYILVDLPPMGEMSDGLAISDLVSGYLFVVRAGMNDVRAIREMSSMIESRGSEILGYIVTDVEDEYYRFSSYYRNYYSYYAGDSKNTPIHNSVDDAASDRSGAGEKHEAT